jgi:acetyltransferase-like isoleucine patch superfamily enzyme
VLIGREATIGAGATILPDVRIGIRAVVGAGALVREDVPDAVRVAGVPAQRLA